ncbi:MAG TPA: hypothetical protein ENF73_00140, partial [Proteobacteria bacterium]|nr:hypothetical protein [Pseudomonadota bacterium]
MANYITIRQLASQLDISAEELMIKLREMGIQVIDPSDTIDQRRVEEIQAFLKGGEEREEGVELKEIVSDNGRVVVRRRRRKKKVVQPAETEAEAEAAEPQQQEPHIEPIKEAEAKAIEAQPQPTAEVPAEGAAGEPQVEVKEGEESKPAAKQPEVEAVEEEKPKPKKRGRTRRAAQERVEKPKPAKRIPLLRRGEDEPAKVIFRPELPTPPPSAPKPKPSDMAAHKHHRKVIEIVSDRARAPVSGTGRVGDLKLDRQERRELREERRRAKRLEKEEAAAAWGVRDE